MLGHLVHQSFIYLAQFSTYNRGIKAYMTSNSIDYYLGTFKPPFHFIFFFEKFLFPFVFLKGADYHSSH